MTRSAYKFITTYFLVLILVDVKFTKDMRVMFEAARILIAGTKK